MIYRVSRPKISSTNTKMIKRQKILLIIQYLFRTGNKGVIHANTHETLRLTFSKAIRRKIKLILYSDRPKISQQKYNLNLTLRRKILMQVSCAYA